MQVYEIEQAGWLRSRAALIDAALQVERCEGTRVVLLQLRRAGFNVGRALFSDDNGDGQGAWRLR